MPKAIKKRPAKKNPVPESEVKGAALHALDLIRKRQKQAIIAASALVVIVILYVIFVLYSSSSIQKAYSFETEAYGYYYATGADNALPGNEKWKKALELFQKSVDIRPSPTALFYLGNCYFKLGDFDNATRQYNTFIDKFSSETGILPLVYQKLASAYFKSNRNDKALEILDMLAKIEDGAFKDTALVLEARYYESAGETGKALEKYREISTEFPASPWSAEAGSKLAAEEAGKAGETSKAGTATKADTPDKP